MNKKYRLVLRCFLVIAFLNTLNFKTEIAAQENSEFQIHSDEKGISSITRLGSPDVEFLAPDARLGEIIVRYRNNGDKNWESLESTSFPWEKQNLNLLALTGKSKELSIKESFEVKNTSLNWTIRLSNHGNQSVEIGDIELPLRMWASYESALTPEGVEENLTQRMFRHFRISGSGSFVYWMPVCGIGSHLLMIPTKNTGMEYYEMNTSNYAQGGNDFHTFIHSAATGPQKKGVWRQKHTRRVLRPNETVDYTFSFLWANDLAGIRDHLYNHQNFDIHIAQSMVIPKNLSSRFAIRTKNEIIDIKQEHPGSTKLKELPSSDPEMRIWEVSFYRQGENMLSVKTREGKTTYLEFFSCKPMEELIKKRGSFIVDHQQHVDSSKWYNGLFSLWDVRFPKGENLLGPENEGGQMTYAVSGSDDPSNSLPVFLSQKNTVWPDAREIKALEYYLENFVWGKLQRTNKERPFPYGIYGSNSWKENRFAENDPLDQAISRPMGPGQSKMWRTFDYSTLFTTYFNMYQIAKANPELVDYLDADEYLERTFGTAKAYFKVPYNIYMQGWGFEGWTEWAYTIGNFHEKYLIPIMDALEKEGKKRKAEFLRNEWDKKVKFFIYDDPYPYISEMPVDATAYESSYAIARFALEHELKPDEKLWQNKNSLKWFSHPQIDLEKHADFMQRQLMANIACRGWLENSYYHLGSDFRGSGPAFYCLSYMSQMGGWSVLDQAFRFEKDPYSLIRLGYASMFSSWALMNQDPKHDGAVGWGFSPQKYSTGDWNPAVSKGWSRGAWPVDGEINHGLTAYVETAKAIIMNDPLFGWTGFGGYLSSDENTCSIIPRDGVRSRLWFINGTDRNELEIKGEVFAKEKPVRVKKNANEWIFTIAPESGKKEKTEITYSFGAGSGTSEYSLWNDGEKVDPEMESVFSSGLEKYCLVNKKITWVLPHSSEMRTICLKAD